MNTWIFEYLNTWILEYLNTWIIKYLNTWIIKYLTWDFIGSIIFVNFFHNELWPVYKRTLPRALSVSVPIIHSCTSSYTTINIFAQLFDLKPIRRHLSLWIPRLHSCFLSLLHVVVFKKKKNQANEKSCLYFSYIHFNNNCNVAFCCKCLECKHPVSQEKCFFHGLYFFLQPF